MKPLYSCQGVRRILARESALHVFTLGFEERCLAFPKFTTEFRTSAGQHRFLCIDPGDESVSHFLRIRRELHRRELRACLPACQTQTCSEAIQEIRSGPASSGIFVDISAMPRLTIFRVLEAVLTASKEGTRVFVVYSYPKEYMYGALQEPAPRVDWLYDEPLPDRTHAPLVLVVPGFDLEYTNVVLSYLFGRTGREGEVRWLIPFPGRRWRFYERVLESHLGLMHEANSLLLPQDQLGLAIRVVRRKIDAAGGRRLFVAPLGPRILCVPLLLAGLAERGAKAEFNVVLPRTRKYTSLRSEGYEEPLIEEIPAEVIAVVSRAAQTPSQPRTAATN